MNLSVQSVGVSDLSVKSIVVNLVESIGNFCFVLARFGGLNTLVFGLESLGLRTFDLSLDRCVILIDQGLKNFCQLGTTGTIMLSLEI